MTFVIQIFVIRSMVVSVLEQLSKINKKKKKKKNSISRSCLAIHCIKRVLSYIDSWYRAKWYAI